MRLSQLRSLPLIFLFIVSFLVAIAFPGLCKLPVQAQTAPMTAPIPTVVYNIDGHHLTIPDWSRITWATMPSVNQAGFVQIPSDLVFQLGYDPSRTWSAGQPIDSVLMLGDIEAAFNVGYLNLSDVQQMQELQCSTTKRDILIQHNQSTVHARVAGGILPPANTHNNAGEEDVPLCLGKRSELFNLDDLTLDDFGILKTQTVATLVMAVPQLGDLDISQVKPIQDLAASLGIESGAIAQVLQNHPDLGELMLTSLDLARYALSSIPGLDQTPLSAFTNWQQSFIQDVPRLNQVPLATLSPQLVSELGWVVAIADNYFSSVEHGDSKVPAEMFVSGSVTCSGETIPVACPAGQPCGYLELSDFGGQNGPNYGKRIASGDDQEVEGGCGPLAAVNGGKEPTGWNAFGGTSTFKLVLRGVDERQARAEFWLNTHLCAHIPFGGKTCTPYFVPVAPVFSVQYNDAVFLGLAQ